MPRGIMTARVPAQLSETGLLVDEHLETLSLVLGAVRFEGPISRPDLMRYTGLGRAIVTQRLGLLIESGIVTEGDFAPSNGGRPSREVKFRADAGAILSAELGATSIGVGVTDLDGKILAQYQEDADIGAGPDPVLARVEQLFEKFVADLGTSAPPIWGIGVGLPGPVEYATGKPVAPPIMPGWDGFDVRGRLSEHFDVPVWVDNDVNVMAVGELRTGLSRGVADSIYIKVGTGVGAALISGGRLHRGAIGVAGDIGHIAVTDDPAVVCRCGKIGCLEAVAGGYALGLQATAAAADGSSPYLRSRYGRRKKLTARELADAAAHGDTFAVSAISSAGREVGRLVAMLVNFFNPSLILFGGGVVGAGDLFLASIREQIYKRSLPLATRDLRIERSALGDTAGIRGAAIAVVDELFAWHRLGRWMERGSPAGMTDLVENPGA